MQESKRLGFDPCARKIPWSGMATHSSILAWGIPMDRGAWWATVCGVTKGQTRLSDLARMYERAHGDRRAAVCCSEDTLCSASSLALSVLFCSDCLGSRPWLLVHERFFPPYIIKEPRLMSNVCVSRAIQTKKVSIEHSQPNIQSESIY